MKYYTGVGSRKTPWDDCNFMTEIANWLAERNWILRSGGADGADKAFEKELSADQKQIFYANDATKEAMEIAAKFHPAWDHCSDYAKKLHGRNSFQVLGSNLKTPSKMLICWTPDGCKSHKTRTRETGGTGTAISIADAYNIPIFNLANKEDYRRIYKKVFENAPF